jgi:hypothetical protein
MTNWWYWTQYAGESPASTLGLVGLLDLGGGGS